MVVVVSVGIAFVVSVSVVSVSVAGDVGMWVLQ